jgi:ribonucleotide reductase beta subunit family protein with ferritin-like domain
MSTPSPQPEPCDLRICALESASYGSWNVRARDESFRAFEPERIAQALAKALAAARGLGSPDEQVRRSAAKLTEDVCQQLTGRRPSGGSIYIEEIQDQAELVLMRAGEHEAARRYVLYREARRQARDGQGAGLPAVVETAAPADPLLAETLDRFVMFPIEYQDLWDAFKSHLALMWTAEEIDLSKDQQDWKKLSADEQYFLKHVMAFFAASDGIVNENLAVRFYHDIKAAEARAFYSMQMLIESIHSETYSLLIDTYISEEAEKSRLLNAVETMPIIAHKAKWALKWLSSAAPTEERLVAFACVEGIFFSSSFCAIYWVKDKKQGLLPGLCFSNELISRDEGLHTDFAVLLHKRLRRQVSHTRMHEILREAVDIECGFATEALPVSLLGMNGDAMRQYIQFVADRLLQQLGAPKLYGARNPFDFMERISLQNKTNFHEKKVAEYRKAGVGSSMTDQMIGFDEDF